jgi:hypothetical protein
MPAYLYEPELLRVEAEWLRVRSRDGESRRLLSGAAWFVGFGVSSALALTHLPSAACAADLRLLDERSATTARQSSTSFACGGRGFVHLGSPCVSESRQ